MFCPNCGNMIRTGAKFCPNCGTAIPETAPAPAAFNEQFVPAAAPVIPEPAVKFEEPVAPVIPEPAVKFEEPVAPVIPEPAEKFEEPVAPVIPEPAITFSAPVPPVTPEPEIRFAEPTASARQPQNEAPYFTAPVTDPVFGTAEAPAPVEEKMPSKEVSTGKFIGLFLLFMLPIIGLILLIVFSKNKNVNIRNFSRMCFIPHIVFMLLLIAAAAVSLLMYYCVDEIRLYSGIKSFPDAVKYAIDKMF